MTIRPYHPTDFDVLLTIFRKHVPVAFGAKEEADYVAFLHRRPTPYVVAEWPNVVKNNAIVTAVVGASGYYVPDTTDPAERRTGHVVWILTDPDAPGPGVGSALLNHCLTAIGQYPNVAQINCRTSQVAYRFFERFGFRVQHTEANFWAPGIDLYFMTKTR